MLGSKRGHIGLDDPSEFLEPIAGEDAPPRPKAVGTSAAQTLQVVVLGLHELPSWPWGITAGACCAATGPGLLLHAPRCPGRCRR
eukprot:4194412-Lingulodinium_polyedra.AAC.1